MRDDLKADLVVDALGLATTRRRAGPGSIHHSDRGEQYPSQAFGRTLRDSGIIASMGWRGDPFYGLAQTASFSATSRLAKPMSMNTGGMPHGCGITLESHT